MNIEHYVGIPYIPNGRTSEGLDCYGLVLYFYKKELGVTLPDYLPENLATLKKSDTMDSLQIIKILYEVEKLEPFDLLWIKAIDPRSMKIYNHVALYLGGGRLLNTTEATGSVISKLSSIEKFIHKIYRYGDTDANN